MSRATCTVCEIHAESTFRIEGLCCQHEATLLERRLGHLPGVERLATDVVRQQLRVCYDAAVTSASAIAEAVAETGMRAWVDRERDVAPVPFSLRHQRGLLVLASVALAAGLAVRLLAGSGPVDVALMIVAVLAGGVTTVRRALFAIRARRLDMYVLMLVAVTGAALIGDWFEAATVVVLFALAQALERGSLDRARQAIRTLVTASPSGVRVRRDSELIDLPLDQVRVGDLLIVAPGDRIALDGTVTGGLSDVNQAPVTGESTPVPKTPGDRIFAGTINGHGSLDVSVTAVGDDTTLARIIHLVERAQEQRAPSQAWVDRFAQRYTPAVLALAVLVVVVPPVLTGQAFGLWGYRALVLLVIACPCALVLSTPISIVSALAAAARHGVLIKGGVHLERLAAVRAIALDKTGTLTEGTLRVARVEPLAGASVTAVLAAAAALAARSGHPVDRAIAEHARDSGVEIEPLESVRAHPGLGLEGTSARSRESSRSPEGLRSLDSTLLGSIRLFTERGLTTPDVDARVADMRAQGMAVVLVARGEEVLGVIGLTDTVRTHGPEAVAALREAGMLHVALLTGDHAGSAHAAAEAGGVDAVRSGLLPSDKVELVHELRERFGPVAMVGDGINDAPALAAADVGIAMGAAGADAAIETADVALMSDDLRAVPFAIRLGRSTLATIRANVAMAIAIKLLFVLFAVAGVATLWMAVVADMGASLLVVANAMRLLRAR
jgi:Cd2+/Zn2+-exporting ATPase